MRPLLAVVLVALSLGSAAGQDLVPQGIAFAQRDGGTWLCRHEDPTEALGCAREHCKEEAPSEACTPVAWCYPAQWSGEMTIAGVKTRTEVLCGMADEAALGAMFSTLCAAAADAESCTLVLTIDPAGNERTIEGVTFAGGGAPKSEPVDADATASPEPAPAARSTDADETTGEMPAGAN